MDVLELRSDPSSLAPERAIVLEVAGTVADLTKAIAKVPGFELLDEFETHFDPDENFVMQDQRKGRSGQPRPEIAVAGNLYLTMPDMSAFGQFLSLWDRWKRNIPPARGFAPFVHLFEQLKDIRPWGPSDRLTESSLLAISEDLGGSPNEQLRLELELWFHHMTNRRDLASRGVRQVVESSGGSVVSEFIMPEISYHGMLIELPRTEITQIVEQRSSTLLTTDDVMFITAQSSFSADMEAHESDAEFEQQAVPTTVIPQPILAIFDGVPVANHELLRERITVDDPEEFETLSPVAQRSHGTAIASLAIHGDINRPTTPISRTAYIRPLLVPNPATAREESTRDRLMVDSVYSSVRRLKERTDEWDAVAPSVFLINFSIGDARRPYVGIMSPLARLIDHLAYKYNLLFLISAGNSMDAFAVPSFRDWTSFEDASAVERQRAVIEALDRDKRLRSILSPAESVNALTIGAQHSDGIDQRKFPASALDPFLGSDLPSVISSLGLGHRRMVKPELLLPGGRHPLRVLKGGETLVVAPVRSGNYFGLRVASPPVSTQDGLRKTRLEGGTSVATALASHAAHRLFDQLSLDVAFAEIQPEYYAVIIKTLLLHRARWNAGIAEEIEEICGPQDPTKWLARLENVSRFIGFGITEGIDSIECAPNQATLIGYGQIRGGESQRFIVPLPACLTGNTERRSAVITASWLTPVSSRNAKYRVARLDVLPSSVSSNLGIARRDVPQPSDKGIRRGTTIHERLSGRNAVPQSEDGTFSVDVFCSVDADEDIVVRYAVAISIESESEVPVYEQVRNRLRLRERV